MRVVIAAVLLASLVRTAGMPPDRIRFDERSSPALATRHSGSCWSPTRGERSFARKINAARGDRSFGTLRLDPQLSKSAKVHTREMARTRQLYHTPSSSLRNRVTNWSILGENVGVGGGVASLHTAFMNSPPHRENVLHRSYRYVGVGVLNRDGRMWVTVLFEAERDPGTTLPTRPRC